jgi:2-polyprenyl-3-methyl-5-hydroxy-6-metoxy-1,4-benzoquinol methylase
MRAWGIVRRISQALQSGEPTPFVVHADYFRVRVFGNGNLHLWFERKDLLKEVNKLLAEFYGEVIGDGYDSTEADDAPEYHIVPAKNHGAFMSSEQVADRVMNYTSIPNGAKVLEPSAGTGVLARAAREQGGRVSCVEIQPGMAHELGLSREFEQTLCCDFLQLEPFGHWQEFDAVIMNPPFDRGRDCDHVRHAWQFVKPGGQLVAIMSARAEFGEDKRHKALHKLIEGAKPLYGRGFWHDLPPGSFADAGTNVNTVILAMRKPG